MRPKVAVFICLEIQNVENIEKMNADFWEAFLIKKQRYTTVDSLYYKEVGFILHAHGLDSKPCVSDTVYETIIGRVDDVSTTYFPDKAFDVTSEYFMVYGINEIPNSEFATDITIETTWTTLDGTTVYGTSKVVNIANTIIEPDFHSGITFELAKENDSLFDTGGFLKPTVVSYESEGIDIEEHDLGEKGFKLIPSGNSYYPSMILKYDDATAGTVLSFMVYIRTDEANCAWWIESNLESNKGDFVPDGMTNRTSRSDGYELNKWIEVSYTLKADVTDGHTIFFNMKNGGEALVESGAVIYMDNFKLTAPTSAE